MKPLPSKGCCNKMPVQQEPALSAFPSSEGLLFLYSMFFTGLALLAGMVSAHCSSGNGRIGIKLQIFVWWEAQRLLSALFWSYEYNTVLAQVWKIKPLKLLHASRVRISLQDKFLLGFLVLWVAHPSCESGSAPLLSASFPGLSGVRIPESTNLTQCLPPANET